VQQNEAFGPDFLIQFLTKNARLTYLSLQVSHFVLQFTDFLAVIQVAPKLPLCHHLFILKRESFHITDRS
jgi:hypothetical protein